MSIIERESIVENSQLDTKNIKDKKKNKNISIFDTILSNTIKQNKFTNFKAKLEKDDNKPSEIKEAKKDEKLKDTVSFVYFGLDTTKVFKQNQITKPDNQSKNIDGKHNSINHLNNHKENDLFKTDKISKKQESINIVQTLENKLENIKNADKEVLVDFKKYNFDKVSKSKEILTTLQDQEIKLNLESQKEHKKETDLDFKHIIPNFKTDDNLSKKQILSENKSDKSNIFVFIREQKSEHKLDNIKDMFLKRLEAKEEKIENIKTTDNRNPLINLFTNEKDNFFINTNTNNEKINKNETFVSSYPNTQVVNYDISGYNNSKSFGDSQQNNNPQPSQSNIHNSNYTSNFQINYQDTIINATISKNKNILNMIIRSSDIVFTPEILSGIKNILENSGYKDLRLSLRDKEKIYKLNLTALSNTEIRKKINFAV